MDSIKVSGFIGRKITKTEAIRALAEAGRKTNKVKMHAAAAAAVLVHGCVQALACVCVCVCTRAFYNPITPKLWRRRWRPCPERLSLFLCVSLLNILENENASRCLAAIYDVQYAKQLRRIRFPLRSCLVLCSQTHETHALVRFDCCYIEFKLKLRSNTQRHIQPTDRPDAPRKRYCSTRYSAAFSPER